MEEQKMDVISLARQLGKAIQQDESYIKMMHCAQVNDEDQELQDLIGQFNLKRVDLNNEINKSDKDQSRIDALNEEVRELYGKLMTNTSMTAYNDAKNEMDDLMDFVIQILRGSINGDDPDTIQYNTGCSGSCASCSGCH